MTRTTSLILRGVAIAIAIVALIDPVFTVERARPQRLVLVNMTQTDATQVEGQLRRLAPDLDVRTPTTGRVPCAPGERCVIAADGSMDGEVPVDLASPIALVILKPGSGPNVSIESATTSANQYSHAAGAARVILTAQGVGGRRTTVRVLDDGAIVGSASVEWTGDSTQAVDVSWWPIAASARTLRIETHTDGDEIAFDNVIDVPVTIGNGRLSVLIFDARPSWSSTFVRRALEDDPRFVVDHRARVAPSLTTGTANARLDAAALEATPLLIVGAPDALTAADVQLIDRFVRVRGGSVIMLPERAPGGAAARLFAGEWSEQLLAEPEPVGALRASELLRPRDLWFGAVALSPVVVATPAGAGRIIVSGAMDAWRYRDADAASFDRFWTSLAAESAAHGARLIVEFDDPLAQAGSRAAFTVRYRAWAMPAAIEAGAVATCDRAESVRLWPAGTPGSFRGALPIGNASSCMLEVSVNDSVAGAGVAVAERPVRGVDETLGKLERAAALSGGEVVTDGDNLEVRLRPFADAARATTREHVHPMRAVWWLLPFVGCLSVEWWLRRRSGSA
jgi:hypothetical protein